jgi:hypothetical protein
MSNSRISGIRLGISLLNPVILAVFNTDLVQNTPPAINTHAEMFA